jgi:hypothetical protein
MHNAELEAINGDGEITDALGTMLDALEQERSVKIGNICRYYKSLQAEADMVKAEAKSLSERASVTANKAESLKNYLSTYLQAGETYADENSKIAWRKSTAVEVDPFADIPKKYQRIVVTADTTALKDALKKGVAIEGCSIVEKNNLQIK